MCLTFCDIGVKCSENKGLRLFEQMTENHEIEMQIENSIILRIVLTRNLEIIKLITKSFLTTYEQHIQDA